MRYFSIFFLSILVFVTTSYAMNAPEVIISPNVATIGTIVTYDLQFTYPLTYELVEVPDGNTFLSNPSLEINPI